MTAPNAGSLALGRRESCIGRALNPRYRGSSLPGAEQSPGESDVLLARDTLQLGSAYDGGLRRVCDVGRPGPGPGPGRGGSPRTRRTPPPRRPGRPRGSPRPPRRRAARSRAPSDACLAQRELEVARGGRACPRFHPVYGLHHGQGQKGGHPALLSAHHHPAVHVVDLRPASLEEDAVPGTRRPDGARARTASGLGHERHRSRRAWARSTRHALPARCADPRTPSTLGGRPEAE
jgi:hypothetical protein